MRIKGITTVQFLLILSIGFIITTLGCSNYQSPSSSVGISQEDQLINISIEKLIEDSISLKDICNTINYIPLETNPECLIGRPKKVMITGNYIIVNDFATESVVIFNDSGKHVVTLNATGKGPGEFVSVCDFSIDESKHIITINDDQQGRLLHYRLDNGEFINMNDNQNAYVNISYFKGTSILLKNSPRPWFKRNQIVNFQISRNGQILKSKMIPEWYNSELFNPLVWRFLYPYQDKMCFWESYLIDTVYFLDQSLNYTPHIIFDLGVNAINESVLNNSKSFQMNSLDYTQIFSVIENDRYVFFNFGLDRRSGLGIHNKRSSKSFLISKNRKQWFILNDIDNGVGFWPVGITDTNKPFQIIQSFEIIEAVKNNSCSDVVKEMTSKLKVTDNPIIMIIN